MAGKDKATIAKEAQEEASNKQAAAEAAAKEATKLEAAAKVRRAENGVSDGSLAQSSRWKICAVKNQQHVYVFFGLRYLP